MRKPQEFRVIKHVAVKLYCIWITPQQNLSRLEDIASELRSQLKTLKRQAETAIQYKTLESQIRTIKVEVLSFQCEQSSRLQQEYTLHMNDLGEQFKLVRSELTTLEHDLIFNE